MPDFPENSLELIYFHFSLFTYFPSHPLLLFDFASENYLLFGVIFLTNS